MYFCIFEGFWDSIKYTDKGVISISYLFSYLFGLNAIKKYLAKKTIVTSTKVAATSKEDIPSPAILIWPNWREKAEDGSGVDPTMACLQKLQSFPDFDFWSCVEENAYTIDQLVANNTETWQKTFKFHMGFLYSLNSSFTMSTDLMESFRFWIKI